MMKMNNLSLHDLQIIRNCVEATLELNPIKAFEILSGVRDTLKNVENLDADELIMTGHTIQEFLRYKG